MAVQLAKATGARVVAIAGGAARVEHAVQTLGADIAVDYHHPAFREQLIAAAGAGIDVYYGRVVLSGSVSGCGRLAPRSGPCSIRNDCVPWSASSPG